MADAANAREEQAELESMVKMHFTAMKKWFNAKAGKPERVAAFGKFPTKRNMPKWENFRDCHKAFSAHVEEQEKEAAAAVAQEELVLHCAMRALPHPTLCVVTPAPCPARHMRSIAWRLATLATLAQPLQLLRLPHKPSYRRRCPTYNRADELAKLPVVEAAPPAKVEEEEAAPAEAAPAAAAAAAAPPPAAAAAAPADAPVDAAAEAAAKAERRAKRKKNRWGAAEEEAEGGPDAKKRRSRWGAGSDKALVPTLPAGLTVGQQRTFLLRVQIEEVNRKHCSLQP